MPASITVFHELVKGDQARVQLDCEGHDRGRERPALLSRGLVALVEHAQQLGMRGENCGIEAGSYLLGVLGYDGRRRTRTSGGWRAQAGQSLSKG